jgi:O-antigen ligase
VLKNYKHTLPGYIFLCTNVIFPWNRFDPVVNLRIFLIIVISPLLFIAIIRQHKYFLGKHQYLTLILITVVIVVQLIGSLYFTKSNKTQQIYGIPLHEIGIISVLCVLTYFLYFVTATNTGLTLTYSNIFLMSGILCATFGLLQILNLNPVDTTLFQTQITGNQGNPNFASSFLAITASVILVKLFEKRIKLYKMVYTLLLISLIIYLIMKTHSAQGIVISYVLFIFTFIYVARAKFQHKIYSVLTRVAFGISLLVIIFSLPLLRKFLKDDPGYIARLDFWVTATRVMRENFLFGVGMDSFSDIYFQYAAKIPFGYETSEVLVISPHNYVIEFATSAGLLLGLLFLALQLYIGYYVFKFIFFDKSIDFSKLSIVIIWIGINLQSLVSPTNIVFLLWFSVTSGLILGWNIDITNKIQMASAKKVWHVRLVALIVGFLLAFPNFNASLGFSRSVEKGEVEGVLNSIYTHPVSVSRLNSISRSLTIIGDSSNSIKVARFAAAAFPLNSGVWKNLLSNKLATRSEKELAYRKLLKIDPFFKAMVKSN